jgi:hypothetical protein
VRGGSSIAIAGEPTGHASTVGREPQLTDLVEVVGHGRVVPTNGSPVTSIDTASSGTHDRGMNDDVHDTLDRLIESGSVSNPALTRLIDDYAQYHAVLAVVGGGFLFVFILLDVFVWKRFRRLPRTNGGRWAFETKTYFSFGVFGVFASLCLALIVAANVSTALDPRPGFSGSIRALPSPPAGTRRAALHDAYNTWLQSSDTHMPSLVQRAIDERLAWQQPKAIICGVLLIVFVVLSGRIWRTLIRNSRGPHARRMGRRRALLPTGVLTVVASLVLMLMVMGNTQASVAPVSLTLFYS